MRTSLLLAITLGGFAVASADTDVCKVHNRRPSEILGNIAGVQQRDAKVESIEGGSISIVPVGVRVVADDSAGTITVVGPKSSFAELRTVFKMFDTVAPKVTAHIKITSNVAKYDSTTTAELQTNSCWAMFDQKTGLWLGLMPRLNHDGSVTSTLKVGNEHGSSTMVARVNRAKTVHFEVYGEHALASLPVVRADVQPSGGVQNITSSSVIKSVQAKPEIDIAIWFDVPKN